MYNKAQELLTSEQEEDRCTGIELLVMIESDESTELLAEQLAKEQSTFVRSRLIEALGNRHSPHVGVVTGRLLGATEASVRNGALLVLQMLGNVAIPVLTELMGHPSHNLRKLAADALDKIAGEAACSLLLSGLRDRHNIVVSACAEALGNRHDFRIVPALTAQLLVTEDIWVAFGIMDSLAKTDDDTILEIIEQYMGKVRGIREQYIALTGIWATSASRLGDERQLVVAWQLYRDKVLTIGQMLTLLDGLQGREINLQQELKELENLLEGFFADKLKKTSTHEMIAAIRLAGRNCPTLLDDE